MTSPNFNRDGLVRRFVSLCSGIEAATMAWSPLGWECAAVAEIEPFPCAVLKHHYPGVPNLGDVNLITREQIEALGIVDVVIFGFPCQDLSNAGKRKGLKNADGTHSRSGLFFKCFEVARWTKARWIVVENVPGLFSSNAGRDFASVVGELAGASFGVPRDGWANSGFALGQNGLVEWAVLDAQYMHLAQRRERVFFVLDTGDWRNRPPLLSDATSLRRHPAPRRETRERIAPTIAARINGGGGLGTDFDCDGGVIPTMRANGDAHSGFKDSDGLIAHTLKGEGFDASEDGTGRGVPLTACPITGNPYGDHESREDLLIPDVAWALQERDSKGSDSSTKEGHLLPVAFPGNLSSTQCASAEDLSPAIGAENPMAVAFTQNGSGDVLTGDISAALSTNQNATGRNTAKVFARMAVRRLTPKECERLQGFPDDFTRIPWRNKPAEKCPDGPRYRALGNSMAVPNIQWIGKQIEQAEMFRVDSVPMSEGEGSLANRTAQ